MATSDHINSAEARHSGLIAVNASGVGDALMVAVYLPHPIQVPPWNVPLS
jgi:hypothetical protein